MADVAINLLPPGLQKLARQAREASASGNWSHVVSVSDQILQAEPGCVIVRRLRQDAHLKTRKRKASLWAKLKGGFAQVKSASRNRNGADEIEATLRADPFSQGGLRRLAELAHQKDWSETEIFALEELCAIDPQDRKSATDLTNLYLEKERLPEAMIAADRLVKAMPRNPTALELYQKVTVAHTMKNGNWESDGSFRDKLRS